MCWRSTTGRSSHRRERCPPQRFWPQHNDGPVPDPPLHPMPFHANFDAPIYDERPPLHVGASSGRSRSPSWPTGSARWPTSASTSCCRAARFDLTQDYGGIVAASMVCEFVGLPVDLAADVLATVNAGSLAAAGQRCRGGQRPARLSGVPDPDRDAPGAPAAPTATCRSSTTCSPTGCPTVRRFTDMEAAVQMLGVFIGGTETVPKIVAHGLWELGRRPDQLAAVRADLDANVPVAREEMIRYCAPAQWFARTLRKPFTIHDTTIEAGPADHHAARVGQPRRARVRRSRRVHLEPAHRAAAGLRSRTALLPRRASGPAGDRDHGDRVAQAGARLPNRQRGRVAAAVELPVGLEQHPGGGLTMWSYRLVAPYTFERIEIAGAVAGIARRRTGSAAVPRRRHLRQRPARLPRCQGPAAR